MNLPSHSSSLLPQDGPGGRGDSTAPAPVLFDQDTDNDLIHIIWKDRPYKTLCGIPVDEYDVVPGGPTGASDECIVCLDLDRVAGEWA